MLLKGFILKSQVTTGYRVDDLHCLQEARQYVDQVVLPELLSPTVAMVCLLDCILILFSNPVIVIQSGKHLQTDVVVESFIRTGTCHFFPLSVPELELGSCHAMTRHGGMRP